MSTPHFKFTGGALKLKGARRAVFEIDVPALPKPAVVEVPTVAPEPVAVVEIPTVSEVEAPAEVPQTSPESGLVPENPSAE